MQVIIIMKTILLSCPKYLNLAARQGWLAAELENLVDDEDRLILDVVLLQEMSRIYIYIYV